MFSGGDDNGKQTGETTASLINKKWGWYDVLYHLADEKLYRMNEITKMNIHECLTFLAYKQDVAQVESTKTQQ